MKEKQSRKTGRQRYEEQAESLAAPIAEQFGTHIYDVEYVREGEEYYLNIYIDKDGGVTIGDCENVSRMLSDELDRVDFIADPYTLIVSSPGLGRALTRDRHLQQSIGQDVEIHLYKPHPDFGEKDLRGELVGFDDSSLTILADAPVPSGGKGRGKSKGKSRKKNKETEELESAGAKNTAETSADTAEASPETEPGGRIRLCVDRSIIASVRLAFDF